MLSAWIKAKIGRSPAVGPPAAAGSARKQERGLRHFLIVQAPFGRFSGRLAERLRAEGHRVTRVVFNGGDLCTWGPRNAFFFVAPTGRYRAWIARRLEREGVTDLVTYGDGHYYTEVAGQEARRLGVAVACLEQGYLRPNWITLERDGVNGSSRLPRDPAVYMRLGRPVAEIAGARAQLGSITRNNVLNIVAYSVLFYFLAPLFPFYRSPVYLPGIVTGLAHLWRYYHRKLIPDGSAAAEARLLRAGRPYFLALMQRPGDSQIVRHSPCRRVRDFYGLVIESFARHAPEGHDLVFKCHPLDQGLSGHRKGIARAARRHGVAGRVHYMDGGQLATLVRGSAGVVTVNSTAGLAALNFGAKAKTLGRAVYDIPGLTYQGDLDGFWTAEVLPDNELFLRYRELMAAMTQVLGSFSTEQGMRLAVETCARRLIAGLPSIEGVTARRMGAP